MSHIRSKSKWLHRKRKSVCQRQIGKNLESKEERNRRKLGDLEQVVAKNLLFLRSGGNWFLQMADASALSLKALERPFIKHKEVEKTLVKRNMKECLDDRSSTEESIPQDESSEWECEPADDEKGVQKLSKTPTSDDTETNSLERRFFVCESTQLMDLVHQVNKTSQCSTKDCNGKRLCSAN